MKKSPYSAMRRIILASMILVPLVTFIIILGVGYYYFTTSLEISTISSMKRIVEDHRHMIESFLRERKANLEFILLSYTLEDLIREKNLQKVFDHLQKVSNAFVDLGFFDESGVHVAYQGPYKLTGKVYREADWFKEVMQHGHYISDVFLGYRRVPHFVIAIARRDVHQTWIIRATIDTHLFSELVKKVRIGKTGEAYILNEKGIFQTGRRSGGNLMDKDEHSIQYLTFHDGIRTFLRKEATGDNYLYATTWLKEKKWLLVVRQEKADAFKALRLATYSIILITVIGGTIIVIVAFYLTDRIVRRMERMDIEKDQLGQQLIRASRLAELGEMAAGFAHEINNPLQIIKNEQSLIETILDELKEKGELRQSEDLDELEDSTHQIKEQVDRCAEITQAILKFGRKSEPVSKDIDLYTFIPEVTAMIEKKASVNGITLKRELAKHNLTIHGDPAQLQQVLLNLLNNAIDAIIVRHRSEGGELVIGAKVQENGKLEIWVKDNGCGISPENLKKIFTPFFTTKPVGRGTGLGLSVCYGIIEHMGGLLKVSSEKGVGTTFTLEMPTAIS